MSDSAGGRRSDGDFAGSIVAAMVSAFSFLGILVAVAWWLK